MEHLLQKSKCSIFHNIFNGMIFQRRQKALLWSKGLRQDWYLSQVDKKVIVLADSRNYRINKFHPDLAGTGQKNMVS